MRNSKILHFIIEELEDSSLTWRGDKELFELIFAPISYGNEVENRRKIAKQYILDFFKNSKRFNKTKFTKLANNIICGENENIYREEVLDFVKNELKRLKIVIDVDIVKLIEDIPCKDSKEHNYRSHFSYWKKNDTAINNKKIKNALEKNFDFSSKLWSRSDNLIKDILQKGIEKFIKKHIKKDTDPVEEAKRLLGLKDDLSEEDSNNLKIIKNMSKKEIEQYVENNYSLLEYKSLGFIIGFISILHSKGYYELLLKNVFEAISFGHKENIEIKKIQAHALGSSEVGEYKKAFDLLSAIYAVDNNDEIIDMQTEAISNMRRFQLNDSKIDNNQKKVIIKQLLTHYSGIFKHNNAFHYYPGINMAYMVAISSNLSLDEGSVDDIFLKAKKSINIDKKSLDSTTRYYANMAIIEFMLLKNRGNPIAEFERFLDMEEESISLIELERTQRQMQFFVDTVVSFGVGENSIVSNMQKAIELIDDFIDYQINQ